MSRRIVHPSLKLLGVEVWTEDGDFESMAFVVTPIGFVSFNRMCSSLGPGAGNTYWWEWRIETAYRADDDFDDLEEDSKHGTLEAAVARAERSLSALWKRACGVPSPLEQLARETSNAALQAQRDAFQERWGRYLKCSKCGARLADSYGLRMPNEVLGLSPCHNEPIVKNSYAPPPPRS